MHRLTLSRLAAGDFCFASLPTGITNLTGLKELHVANCGLLKLPGIYKLSALSSLTITSQSPQRSDLLTLFLENLTRLQSLDLSSREIPLPLRNLTNLQHFTLRGLRPSCRRSHDPERVRNPCQPVVHPFSPLLSLVSASSSFHQSLKWTACLLPGERASKSAD